MQWDVVEEWDRVSRNYIDVVGGFWQSVVVMSKKSCWSGAVKVSELGDRLSALRLMSEPSQQVIEASLVRYGQLSPVIVAFQYQSQTFHF